MIVQLEGFGTQRLELAHLLLAFERQLFLCRQLVARRDPDDVASLALVQPLGVENDVEGLVPGDVLQSQRQRTTDGVGRDDVVVGEVGDHLQHRTHVDILEIQRQLLALVARLAALNQLVRILDQTLHLEDELILALVGVVLPETGRSDREAGIGTRAHDFHLRDRRAEVGHVIALQEFLGHRGAQEFDHQLRTLLADVDTDVRIRQFDHDATFTILAAAEADVAQGLRTFVRSRLGESGRFVGLGDSLCVGRHRQADVQVAPGQPGIEGGQLVEVEHQSRTVTDLDDVEAAQVRFVQVLGRAAERVSGRREIEGDARGRGDAEVGGHRGQFGLGRHLDQHLPALLRHQDGLDAVRLCLCDGKCRYRSDGERAQQAGEFADEIHFFASCSCNWSVLVRSTHSPSAS